MAAAPKPPLGLPESFRRCCRDYAQYPGSNAVVSRAWYGDSRLAALRENFESREPRLFVIDGVGGRHIKVPVRDVLKDGSVFKLNVMRQEQLNRWLGDGSSAIPPTTELATKADPKCRFVFLINDSLTSPLEISTAFLTRIFTYHQVTPSFLDFLYVYGTTESETREARFSGFRTERVLENPDPGNIIPDLERSGRRYQMCYNLKTVVMKVEDTDEKAIITKLWTIRQSAIHHQLDVGSSCQLWIFGDPHAVLQRRIAEVFSEHDNHKAKFDTLAQSLATCFRVHHINCRWATEGWPEYVKSLEEIVDNLTSHLLSHGQIDDKRYKITLKPGSIGNVQAYEDKTNEAIMVLESNVDIMRAMSKFYTNLVTDNDFPPAERKACQRAVQAFSVQLGELIYDARTLIARARILAKIVADRKTILIQHLQAQAAARAEEFTATMWKATERSENEAIAMRIITVITMIYLPPTFASTFFSTDVVKYQNGGGAGGDGGAMGESRSWLALYRWLEVSLPLMAITFGVAVFWYTLEYRKRQRRFQLLRQKHPDVFNRID